MPKSRESYGAVQLNCSLRNLHSNNWDDCTTGDRGSTKSLAGRVPKVAASDLPAAVQQAVVLPHAAGVSTLDAAAERQRLVFAAHRTMWVRL